MKAILRVPPPKNGALLAILLDAVLLAVVATQHWHRTRAHHQQAEAARQAAVHLRRAYQAAAADPLAVLQQRGTRLAESLRRRQTAILRQALPELADEILAEPGWPALAATLAKARSAGHDPGILLAEATAQRELDTATSLSQTLIWRLHRLADLFQHTTNAPGPLQATTRVVHPSTQQRRAR